jgi:hypothetical protein
MGFSYEDMIFNTLGVAAGYLLWSFPDLSRKIDLRVESQASPHFT